MPPVPPDSIDSGGSGDERHVPHEVVPSSNHRAPRVEVRCPSIASDDESGNMLDRDYTGMFEGPEKTLEVVFRRINGSTMHQVVSTGELNGAGDYAAAGDSGPIQRQGLRRLPRGDLDRICARARCTILSVISNRYLDAYVLSESSLFVYPYM